MYFICKPFVERQVDIAGYFSSLKEESNVGRATSFFLTLQERASEMESRAQMAEARVGNLKGQLEMKEDVAQELKAAFDRRNDLDAMYVPAKHLTLGDF